MKSIIEEASSIMKAIEKGWTNAGQPKEFTVKIFEDVQKNFIGMTTKPAKIGIFFADTQSQQTDQQPNAQKKATLPQAQKKAEPVRPPQVKAPKPAPVKQAPVVTKEAAPEKQSTEGESKPLGPVWNDEMILSVRQWLQDIFPLIDIEPLAFTIEPDHFLLKIHFEKQVYSDKTREKHLFSSLSTLIITMLKRHYKRPLKGYKIVLVGA